MLQPVVAVQRVLPKSEVAIGSTTVVFAQSLSGAVLLALADAVFQSKLRAALTQTSLDRNRIQRVIGAGAIGYRQFIHGEELQEVAACFNFALTRVFVSLQQRP